MPITIRHTPLPSASAAALAVAEASAPARVLRARKPLPYDGSPVELVTLLERAVLSVLLLAVVGCWWLLTSAPPPAG